MTFAASLHAFTDFGNDVVPFHEGLRQVREAGYEEVMLLSLRDRPGLRHGDRPQCSLLDYSQADPTAIAEALEEAGLRLAVMFGAGPDLSTDDAAAGAIEWLTRLADVAVALGCRFFGHGVGVAPEPGMPTEAKADQIRRLARVMDGLGEQYAGALYFSGDVHWHGIVETVADCELLISELETPNTGPLLNIGHMTTLEQEGWTLLERYPERIRFIAWKDHSLAPDRPHPVTSVELGTADSPFDRYIPPAKAQAGIERVNTIAIETTPLAEKPAAMARSLDYLTRLWAGVA